MDVLVSRKETSPQKSPPGRGVGAKKANVRRECTVEEAIASG